jgi:metallo-beta-lactamase class B
MMGFFVLCRLRRCHVRGTSPSDWAFASVRAVGNGSVMLTNGTRGSNCIGSQTAGLLALQTRARTMRMQFAPFGSIRQTLRLSDGQVGNVALLLISNKFSCGSLAPSRRAGERGRIAKLSIHPGTFGSRCGWQQIIEGRRQRLFFNPEVDKMTILKKLGLALALAVAGVAQAGETAVNCDNCKEWNKPAKPFNVYGNTWYVGVNGISSVLITGPGGHILVDGALPQSAALIEANIKALGFRIEDVKLIVNSHAHWDHAGGIAALQRASGAVVAASASGVLSLKSGTHGADDPQYYANSPVHVAKVAKVKVVRDGETVQVGPVGITAHMTPGHTPGSTSWSWTSCEGQRCMSLVYADSLNPISRDGFSFTGQQGAADISSSFASSIAKLAALNCDIVLSAHPNQTDTFAKAAARTPDRNPFIDAGGCRAYAGTAARLLDERIAKERGGH